MVWRTPLLTLAALVAMSRQPRAKSAVVPILHLAALESCVTDLLGTGWWAIGWANHDPWAAFWRPGILALALAFSTMTGRRRAVSPAIVRLVWPFAVVCGVFSTPVGPRLLTMLTWTAVGSALFLLAGVWMVALRDGLSGLRVSTDRSTRWLPAAALWVVGFSLLLSKVVFESLPHVPDEVGYWFHAKYFASGQLWLPMPPDWASFSVPNSWHIDGRWFSIFPPGWPAVFALGFLLHAPTAVNPMLAGLTVIALFRVVGRLYDRRVATVACLLLILSPEFLLMSSGVMSHPLSALCSLVAVGELHRAWQNRSLIPAFVGGAAVGAVALTRPFEGIVISAAFGLYMLARWREVFDRKLVPACLMFILAAGCVGALLLPYNHALTGSAFADPITAYFDAEYYPGSNRLGFGPDIANYGWANNLLPGHSPLEAVLNGQLNWQLINVELLAWPCGALAVVIWYFAKWKRIGRIEDVLFVLIGALVIGGQGLFWYSGADYGARYWYQILIPCIVLAARALTDVGEDWESFAMTAVVVSAIGLAVFLPWRAVTKYVGYRGMGGSVVRFLERCDMSNGLVVVGNAPLSGPFHKYSAAAFLNEPGWGSSAPVFARETTPAATERLKTAFPGRTLWHIEVPDTPDGDVVLLDAPPSACRDGR